jgi:HEPN/RES N-terminal domain 1/RES domain
MCGPAHRDGCRKGVYPLTGLPQNLAKAKKRKTATGPAKVIIVNPDQGAANRIPAIAGPTHQCEWIFHTCRRLDRSRMKDSDDDTEVKDRRLCSGCIGEAFLRAEIEKEGESGTCHYCGKSGVTTSIDEMADRIETAFEQHYQRTATEPSLMEYAMIKEGDCDWWREVEPVVYAIGSAAEIDEAAAKDIRQVLEDRHGDFERDQMGDEGPFDGESQYVEKEADDIKLQEDWRYFENCLKTEARFFNGPAEAILEKVFKGLADHRVHDGKSIIVEAGPGIDMPALFRARIFQSVTKLGEALKSPDRDIGSPPVGSALAGRMNARGISVFYGATNASVAIGEVRPPVGSRVVVLIRKCLVPEEVMVHGMSDAYCVPACGGRRNASSCEAAHDSEPAFSAKNRSAWTTRDAGVPPDIDGLET